VGFLKAADIIRHTTSMANGLVLKNTPQTKAYS